jgi:hypothetical protein
MAASKWYAVEFPIVRTGRKAIAYVEADSRQAALNIDPGATLLGGPYGTVAAAEKAFPQGSHGSTASSTGTPTVNATPGNPLGWLTGFGGDIASGLEGGIDAIISDIWNVIEGPLLVLLGLIILAAVLIIFFKNDMSAGLGSALAMAAAA